MKYQMLSVKKLHQEAKLPTKSTQYAAGYDLYSLVNGSILPRSRGLISTGIAIALPTLESPLKVYGSIRSRSGLSVRKGIEVGAGVIDEDYRGEVKVLIHNLSDEEWVYEKGERIGQIILEVYISPEIGECVELPNVVNNVRGINGFGSSGR